MTITIERRDLFTVSKDYTFCHCVSADFALGAGIAKRFAKLGVKNELDLLHNILPEPTTWNGNGFHIITRSPEPHGTINLVRKERYWHKPTLEALEQSLLSLHNSAWIQSGNRKIAMPKIGCGLDRLKWSEVEPIIKKIFADLDVNILVCDWS